MEQPWRACCKNAQSNRAEDCLTKKNTLVACSFEEIRRRLCVFTTSPNDAELPLIFWLLLHQGKSNNSVPGYRNY